MRLFVAVWPSPEVVGALQALDRPSFAGVKWTGPAQWHVTLRFLGSVPEEELPAVVSAVDAAAGEVTPVEAVLGPVTDCFGRGVLHVPVAGLDRAAEAVLAGTEELGEPPEGRAFTGHLTLARSKKGQGPDLRRLAGAPVTGAWPVEELTVVSSKPGPDGSRYDVVHRAPLRG